MDSLGSRVYAFVILIDITKFLSAGFVSVHTPTDGVCECPTVQSLSNKVHYSERFLVLIKHISRIRELIKNYFISKNLLNLLKPLPWAETNKQTKPR